jgi:hypothetical protein
MYSKKSDIFLFQYMVFIQRKTLHRMTFSTKKMYEIHNNERPLPTTCHLHPHPHCNIQTESYTNLVKRSMMKPSILLSSEK